MLLTRPSFSKDVIGKSLKGRKITACIFLYFLVKECILQLKRGLVHHCLLDIYYEHLSKPFKKRTKNNLAINTTLPLWKQKVMESSLVYILTSEESLERSEGFNDRPFILIFKSSFILFLQTVKKAKKSNIQLHFPFLS